MDDEPVLRDLAADLERDDPALAAALSGPLRAPHPHRLRWFLVVLTALPAVLLLPPSLVFGVCAVLLIAASPIVACWWCVFPDDGPAPHHG